MLSKYMLEMEHWVISAVSTVLLVIGLQCILRASVKYSGSRCVWPGSCLIPCPALNRPIYDLEDYLYLALHRRERNFYSIVAKDLWQLYKQAFMAML